MTAAHKPRKQLAAEPTFREKVRYAFDATMARGPSALVGWLALATLILIGIFSAIILITGTNSGHRSVFGQLFYSLLHALDPGTIAGDSGSWRFLGIMLLLTLGGLFIVSALIGIIATGLDEKLIELRKGRSRVLERDHTLVLGWSETVFTIVSELSIANESRKKPSIVILADQDKVEMEDAIRAKVPDTKNTRVVCRTGSPIDLDDLEIVGHQSARSIIVLSPDSEDPASEGIQTVPPPPPRAPPRRGAPAHPAAKTRDPSTLEAPYLVAGDEAVIMDKRETVAR